MSKLRHPEELILRIAKTCVKSALDNAAELAKFGWKEEKLQQFLLKVKEVEDLTDENYNKSKLVELTAEKNIILDECNVWAQDLKTRALQVFEKNSSEIVEFPTRLLLPARHSERKMMPVMKGLIEYSKTHKEKLAVAGQTDQIISQGEALYSRLSAKDEQQEAKKEKKRSETEYRHIKFNDLYKTINKINAAARRAFRTAPEKKVLFLSPWPKRKNKGQKGKNKPHDDWVI